LRPDRQGSRGAPCPADERNASRSLALRKAFGVDGGLVRVGAPCGRGPVARGRFAHSGAAAARHVGVGVGAKLKSGAPACSSSFHPHTNDHARLRLGTSFSHPSIANVRVRQSVLSPPALPRCELLLLPLPGLCPPRAPAGDPPDGEAARHDHAITSTTRAQRPASHSHTHPEQTNKQKPDDDDDDADDADNNRRPPPPPASPPPRSTCCSTTATSRTSSRSAAPTARPTSLVPRSSSRREN
jgi:hypothetical protein